MAITFFAIYDRKMIKVSDDTSVFVLVSPEKRKPPLLLIHGFPQTHVEFHEIAPLLEPHFTLILLDLRGYGNSSSPPSTNGSGMSKRLMAADCIAVMKDLEYTRFSVLGHDRGARVAYRMAFNSPENIENVIVVDIIPTASNFVGFGQISSGLKAYHWLFLAQPAPLPENLIVAADEGRYFLRHTVASWTGRRSLEDFDPLALKEYEKAYCRPERIHSTCEYYRAGAHIDSVHDQEDLDMGKKIALPMLVVWGEGWLAPGGEDSRKRSPLDAWKSYASVVVGVGLPCGHFIPEEDPRGLATEVLKFFKIEHS